MIGILPLDTALFHKAQKLAKQLSLPLLDKSTIALNATKYSFLLVATNNRLEIQAINPINKKQKPIYVDFSDPTLIFRITHNSGKKQLISKAIGIKSKYKPFILDATAGLGVDAMILACLGCKVHMLERSPIVGALLTDGLERLEKTHPEKKAAFLPTNFSLKLTITQSLDYIKNFTADEKPDVIYLDPMYPERKKSALGKQQMRLIKEIVGNDQDAHELLEAALELAAKRVVVKRPRLAPSLASHRKPDLAFNGNSSRYDVYITHIR